MNQDSEKRSQALILGAGVTGLAAGLASGLAVYEASANPGGICASYYVRPNSSERLHSVPHDEEAYRFEIGGGHWIWGGDPVVLRLISSFTPVDLYNRRAAVFFPEKDLYVPYPLQYHLKYLAPSVREQALQEMVQASATQHPPVSTMADWLKASFGRTLCDLFFDPFHELYTSGLWKTILPPDATKSPVDLELAIQGAFDEVPAAGYNTCFIYPRGGLNTLAEKMSRKCRIKYSKRVVKIDVKDKVACFADGSSAAYEALISTIALNRMIELCGLALDAEPDPFTSVLVINIGAVKGTRCPREQWLYLPKTEAGFHRVGFYSNVDASFIPLSSRMSQERVSIYVEKGYPGGHKPDDEEVRRLCQRVAKQLREWGWIKEQEVVDPTWIDTAYAWSRNGSQWRQKALHALEAHEIYQIGRYGRWASQLSSQGISESIKDGLFSGAAFGGEA
jgi:protoporphyrinogen oxidase